MKQMKRIAALFIITIFMLTSLTACSEKDKLELMNAFEKTGSMNSWESQGKITFAKVSMDTNVEELQLMQPFLGIMDGLEISSHQVTVQNAEKTRIRTQNDMTILSQDIHQDVGLWMDLDLSQNPPVMNQIIKLPEMVSGSLPGNLASKQYMVINEATTAGLDPSGLSNMGNLQTDLLDIIKGYAAKQGTDFIVVTQLADQVVNGERRAVYQLKLTDASFKVILKALLNEMPDNEEVKGFIKEFMLAAIGASSGKEGSQDLSDAFDALRDGKSTFKEDLAKVGEMLDDITFLGDQGIVVNFQVNPDGYIVNQNGTMDFYMNTQQVENALARLAKKQVVAPGEYLKAVMGLTMNFNMDVYNINQDLNITFPTLTKENSFNMDDLIYAGGSTGVKKVNMKAQPASKMVKSTIVETKVYPVKLGKTLYVPLEPVCKALNFKLEKRKKGSFSIKTNSGIIRGQKDSWDIQVNQDKKSLEMPVFVIEDQLFATSQFVESYLGAKINYEKGNKMAVTRK